MKDIRIGIIGLGYVGLPVAIEFSKKFKVFGFDINSNRINELLSGIDSTNESDLETLAIVSKATQINIGLTLSDEIEDLKACNVFIVTVPTPINKFKAPNLKPLLDASKMIGKILKKEDYKTIFIANLDNSFQRFQFLIFLYSLISLNFNYYLVDETGNISKFNLFKFIFIQTPLFLIELIISSFIILYFNFRLSNIYSKIK